MKSIYVGNLSYKASAKQVKDLFSQYGEVLSVRLISDKKTGKLKGYGFIEMEDENAASAIKGLDKAQHLGRTLKVSETKLRECDQV